MGLKHLLNLCLVLALKHLDDGLLVVLSLLFVLVSSFLELFNRHLEFLLRFDQVSLVIVFLSLEEHDLSFPERLVSIIVAL